MTLGIPWGVYSSLPKGVANYSISHFLHFCGDLVEAGTQFLSLTHIPPSCWAELGSPIYGQSGLVCNGITHFTDTKHEDSGKLNKVKCQDTLPLTPNSWSLPSPISHDAHNCRHLDPLWLVSRLEPRRHQAQNISSPWPAPLLLCPSVCHHGLLSQPGAQMGVLHPFHSGPSNAWPFRGKSSWKESHCGHWDFTRGGGYRERLWVVRA